MANPIAETVAKEEFRDLGLLTFGDGITVKRTKDPELLVITWREGHRRLLLNVQEARGLADWIKAALL